ncbi:MAG: Fe-S cluster assembly sulfur transfer protein SufU [Gemmatimonadota bacterium]
MDETPQNGRPIDRSVPSSLHQLYQEVILDHYRRPRNKGPVENATHSITLNNPLCGDVVEVVLAVENDRITKVGFGGKGCSISMASASMMTHQLMGKTLAEAMELTARFTEMLHGNQDAAHDEALGDLRALAGVAKFPVRIKCALLCWNCLDKLIEPELA